MTNQLNTTWRIVSGGPPAHITRLEDGHGQKAVLKLARDRSEKKLIEPFNEIACARFAGLMDVSKTETSLERVNGEPGIISTVKSEVNFSHVQSTNMTLSPANQQFMATLFVSDWWLANIDRAPGKVDHVMVVEAGDDVTLCPIDYSHALNGCSGELFTLQTVTDTMKISIASYQHISEPYIRTFTDLEPAIKKVGMIEDSVIAEVVETTAAAVAGGSSPGGEVAALQSNAEVVKAMLKARRDAIRPTMMEWCRLKGRSIN
jgi:hypothetical protein